MQRVSDALREENTRLHHKCEMAGELANQRMQEIGGMRRQLGEIGAASAACKYEVE
jgi:hypothetical protein